MGLFIHFYIIFGTNLLTGGPAQIAVFLPISVFRRKGISNGVQTEWNLRERDFWNKLDPEDLEWTSRNQRGSHEVGRRACPPGRAPTLVGPSWLPDRLPPLIYIHVPPNIQEHHENLIPPPQPSVLERSHLGAFSGAPPEGSLITEGLYTNSMASPVMCE